jgi:hypothetical protein
MSDLEAQLAQERQDHGRTQIERDEAVAMKDALGLKCVQLQQRAEVLNEVARAVINCMIIHGPHCFVCGAAIKSDDDVCEHECTGHPIRKAVRQALNRGATR